MLSRSVYIFVSASFIEMKCSKYISRAVVCCGVSKQVHVDATIMNRHNSEKYTKIKKSHLMNSVFVQPGIYSCAIDCFLEVSTYLFLPVL